jgi:hypothetical protein
MADIFLSYAHADREQAAAVAQALEAGGRSLWWDRRLGAGEDYGQMIEREIDAARCVVVNWSKTARDSLWVRAEANAALDQDKLLQLNLDGGRLPLPFTMLHALDFSIWSGRREHQPWPELETRVEQQLHGSGVATAGLRPETGDVPLVLPTERTLQGFETVAMIGWTAIAAAFLVGIMVLLAIREQVTAQALGFISIVALAVAIALLGVSGVLLVRTQRASRR